MSSRGRASASGIHRALDTVVADARQRIQHELWLGRHVHRQRAKIVGVGHGEGEHVARVGLKSAA